MRKTLHVGVLAMVVGLTVASCAQYGEEAPVVKIICRDGEIAALQPERLDVLFILRSGSVKEVPWELETAGCPERLSRVEIRFPERSPFGYEPADTELIVPELPTPLPPESLPLISRSITMPAADKDPKEWAREISGKHRYIVRFLDAEGQLLSQREGAIMLRTVVPALDTAGLLAAGLVLVFLFWLLRYRLFVQRAA
ncbi:MAG: hypothetical protein N3E42_03230 [Candidatus Bipolaricaulota bacterium]|nr:hypothetical protein [Candidatus Bipolaricaulota bacterium]